MGWFKGIWTNGQSDSSTSQSTLQLECPTMTGHLIFHSILFPASTCFLQCFHSCLRKKKITTALLMYWFICSVVFRTPLCLALTHEVLLFNVVINDTGRLHIQHLHWCQSTTEAKRSKSQQSTSVLCLNNIFQSRGDRMKSGWCTDSDLLLSWVDFRSVYRVFWRFQ